MRSKSLVARLLWAAFAGLLGIGCSLSSIAAGISTAVSDTATQPPTEMPSLLAMSQPASPVPTKTVAAVNTQVADNTFSTATQVQNATGSVQVKLYFVVLNDNGKSGKLVGCGDSLVAVDRDIPHSASPLTDTLTALFAVKTQYYGQSGLYNALYQSDLKVEGVSAHNGVFRVNLVGKTQLGGECDDPRFIGQIRETALQFPTVKQVDIYVNGTPIEKLISGIGS